MKMTIGLFAVCIMAVALFAPVSQVSACNETCDSICNTTTECVLGHEFIFKWACIDLMAGPGSCVCQGVCEMRETGNSC